MLKMSANRRKTIQFLATVYASGLIPSKKIFAQGNSSFNPEDIRKYLKRYAWIIVDQNFSVIGSSRNYIKEIESVANHLYAGLGMKNDDPLRRITKLLDQRYTEMDQGFQPFFVDEWPLTDLDIRAIWLNVLVDKVKYFEITKKEIESLSYRLLKGDSKRLVEVSEVRFDSDSKVYDSKEKLSRWAFNESEVSVFDQSGNSKITFSLLMKYQGKTLVGIDTRDTKETYYLVPEVRTK